ncbi:DNA-binding transcriptional regulator [Klebsiella pneumoniae]|uniref:DNA-binding transcriptional regulator n=1 Tax=Klebsiella pneumoniae TaxID=573 RepID=A0A377TLF1_KLEPN|nr:DNA-binding transcriptional regulator [Klebsiella pneumoniae]
MSSALRNCLRNRSRVFARAGHPAAQATSLGELMDHHWTMPTPRGSYFKQLQERFEQLGREPKVGIVCETFSSCISLVVKSDFLSILPVELGNDPLMADKLVMIPIVKCYHRHLLSDPAARYPANAAHGVVNHPVPPPEPTIVSLIVRRAHFTSERG